MNTETFQDVIDFVVQYGYYIGKEGDNFRAYETHGDFNLTTDDLEYAVSSTIRHFLKHALGHRYAEIWQALKKFNRHKTLFINWQDIDRALEYEAILWERFVEKHNLIEGDEPIAPFDPENDIPF